MIDENLVLLIIFLIILTFFYFLNKILNKNIEKYGTYCGRYNIDKSTAQKYCTNDIECIWNNYKAKDGTSAGWCGQNPSTTGDAKFTAPEPAKKNEFINFYSSIFNGTIFNQS